MIGYTTVGTRDLERARAFYDSVLEPLGARRLLDEDHASYWGRSPAGTKFAVTLPFDEQPASAGNGVMIALRAEDREQVDAVYARALSHGGSDEGPVGPRGTGSFYGGYFRDPDGNKISVFTT